MSQPMTANQLLTQLKKWGVRYNEVPGWRTHNRDAVGAWGPVNGFMVHHTGDDAVDSADRRVIVEGRSDLPGPLAQFGCNDNGVIDLVGWGRANHAGAGDPNVFQAVIHESYGNYPPKPHYHQGSPLPPAVDGNSHFYGVETYYSGGHVPTQEAYHALVLLAAAVCDFHGWSAKSVIGHKEWSDAKVDPGRVDMKGFRADVAAALKAGPTKAAQPKPVKRPHKTPNITEALALNEQYAAVLRKITSGPAHAAVQQALAEVNAQHAALLHFDVK